MTEQIARETVAAVQHEIWSHWMNYLFSRCQELGGSFKGLYIPYDDVASWKRLANMPYSELSEQKKDSDREQADKVLAALEQEIVDAVEKTVAEKLSLALSKVVM
jgi:hypothetical protein